MSAIALPSGLAPGDSYNKRQKKQSNTQKNKKTSTPYTLVTGPRILCVRSETLFNQVSTVRAQCF